MAQNGFSSRVSTSTAIQIENGTLSAQQSLVHSAAKGRSEPTSTKRRMS
jgi:hypothetical protein